MQFPEYRGRRLRKNENFRRLVRETKLSVDDLVYPLFAVPGKSVKKPINSMPGQFQLSVDYIAKEARTAFELGIPAVLLFGIPAKKDEQGTGAFAKDGIVQQTVKRIKNEVPEMLVITDVCLCEYTSHGHCGILEKGQVQNDMTLEVLAETALSHAQAGADMVAPSAMMDGQIAAIRETLDENALEDIPIMAYSAKYASSFYGPFREAAESAPQFGDRKAYQMARLMLTRLFGKYRWMFRKARTSSWSNRHSLIWMSSVAPNKNLIYRWPLITSAGNIQ
jgi:porphobilinogen synthase